MKIAIMGSGGVGGYFGAKLAAAGYDVTFIARGSHLQAIRRDGLRIRSSLGDLVVRQPQLTERPGDVGPVDLVLFAVKLWDTESAAEAIKPLIGPGTGILSLQNGVIKDEILADRFGRSTVIGGVCYIAAAIGEPGVIVHTGTMQRVVFGEYDGSRSKRVTRLFDACAKAGIESAISDDIRRAIWEKFVFLCGLSATTATTRCPIGVVRSHAPTRHLLASVMGEVVAVGGAEGVAFSPDFVEDRLRFCDQLPYDMTSSMHHDLERGNRLEVAWLSGDVSRRGARLGVVAPYNTAVYDILAVHAAGRSE